MIDTPVAPYPTSEPADTADRAPEDRRVRLDFLDGVRGLAALYVVMHHTWMEMGWEGRQSELPLPLQHIMSVFLPGSFAVAIFIVLSGYCLMLPVARNSALVLRGGTASYLKRRAHRILPPYYAALGLSLLLIACLGDLRRRTGIQVQLAMTNHASFFPALISHLGLFHNVSANWAFKFNSPLWSVGTEWQIYFLLPWLLLPIWRRYGVVATAFGGYAVGLAPHYLFHGRFDSAAPWFIGLFAMGMAGAGISFSPRPFERVLRTSVPWGVIAAVSGALVLGMCYRLDYGKHYQQMEIVLGLPVMALLIYCALHRIAAPAEGRVPGILGLFESRFATWLGAMSYSLYLTHILVVEIVNAIILRTGISPTAQILVTLPLNVMLAVALGYGFHLLIERRFMPGHLQRLGRRL